MNAFMVGVVFLWLAVSVAFFLIARPEVVRKGRVQRVVYEYMVLLVAALIFPVLAGYYGTWRALEERETAKRKPRR
jgi:small-conductance mechanosensitive channel